MTKTGRWCGAKAMAGAVAALLLGTPLAGWAQLEEIVVTTRKIAENIQDVPIAVDAISSEQIERRGITDVAEVVKLSTSVQFDQAFGPQDTRISVRGLSNSRGRSNVAFLVDGVDVTTENFISAGSGLLANQRLLTDVERIEIVKGPQSALYGRAAFAGAISYTTKEPGPEFESQVRVEAGNYGKRQIDGFVSGPVSGLEGILGMRWTGAVWNRDGFYTNATTGQDMGDESGWGTAVTAVFTPDNDIKIKLRTEYSDSETGQRPNVRVAGGSFGRAGAGPFEGMAFYPYPIDPDIVQGTSNTTTRLSDFGEYCPEAVPDQGSPFGGICQPPSIGSAKGLQPAVDVDPVTGTDYAGSDAQLWRTTLNASIFYDYGTLSLISGWTDYNVFDELDQDYQVAPVGNPWKGHQQGRSDLDTEQFSTELRFVSILAGPVNFTLGGMYWREDRKLQDLTMIISCLEYGKAGPGNVFPDPAVFVPGICDGTNGTISSWQERALDLFPCEYDSGGNPIADPTGQGNCRQAARTPAPWSATTEHWSAYFNLTWNLTDTFELVLENRYVDETFDLLRPSFSPCTNLFFAFGTGTSVRANGDKEGVVATAADDIVCDNERRMNPNIPDNINATTGDWMLIEGTERSSFNTPKVTLNWRPNDSMLYYFSWGKGIKPGGISTIAAGGSPTTIDDERFLPERVQAWEFGTKTDWEFLGFMRVNGSLFLNDYTDKQVGTQIVTPDGQLEARVVNAASAEVWGLELEAIWQADFLPGLLLSASYTYLDPVYNEFEDVTRSFVRAANTGQCPLISLDDEGNRTNQDPLTVPPFQRYCALDLSGKQLERTPKNAFNANLQYTAPFMDTFFDWFVELNSVYQDRRFLDQDNAQQLDEYWLVDTRGGLTGETFEFLVYVDNLFDDDTIRTGGAGPDFARQVTELGFSAGLGTTQFFGVLPTPRTFGVRLTMRF
jgi:outer membrane receptor protein involved in Fe transport